MNMTRQHSRVRWAYRTALRGAYPHLLRDSWEHSRSWGSSRKSSSWSSSDPGLQTEAKRTLPHKPQTSGASSAAKKKKRILWVLPRLTVGNDNSGCRAQAGGFHLIRAPDTEKLVGARDVADTLSTHWPESKSGRRNNSWFRTSSIFLLVTCTHWIL